MSYLLTDDPEARKIANEALKNITLSPIVVNATSKLQKIYDNKPPESIVL
jgi:hypothetical protein